MAKVHVVGAGPAGSIAAISAARSGLDVIVSEEHDSAGMPCNCSGLFSKDGLESLSSFLDYRKHIINPIYGARIHLAGEVFTVRRNKPVAFVCNRPAMDLELANCAEAEGAKMNYGERVTSSFHAENIIGADGPHSTVARHFRFPPLTRHVATMQAELSYRSDDPGMIDMYLSNEQFPGFFGWIIPHDEYVAEFGAGVELPHRPTRAWNHLMRLSSISHTSAPAPKGFIIPLQYRARTAMQKGKRNILLCGDAAGQVKSTTGGGVVFGGNCAALAGKLATDPFRYELEWRLRFGTDLALHNIIHSFLVSLSDCQLSVLGRKLKKLRLDNYLSDYGHMDRPTRMLRLQLLVHVIKNAAGFV